MYENIFSELYKIFEPCWYVKIKDNFYHITNRDFMIYEKTFSSLAPSAQTGDTVISELEPEQGQLYIFVIGVVNNVTVQLKQPAAVSKWGVKGQPLGSINIDISPAYDPNPATMVATVKDNPIVMNIINNTNTTLTPKVRFIGLKYTIEEVTDAALRRELERRWREGKLPEITLSGLTKV